VQGETHVLQPDDLVVHRHSRGDVVVETDGEVFAGIDPAITDDLRQEGLAREVVSRVQRLRRDAGYRVSDRIELWVGGDEPVRKAAERHAEYIAGETLALAVAVAGPVPAADLVQELDLDGFTARIAVRRVG